MSSLIGKPAPDFTAKAVTKQQISEITLSQFEGQYLVLFFYPLDFTFVCPTELHAFQEKYEEFKKRGANLVACSVDSPYSHHAWLNTPKKSGGIQGVEYPIISDLNKTIAWDYQVLNEDEGIAYRGLFIIDRKGIVRHQLINDLPLGRNVDEAIRTLDALIHHEQHGEVCPANWQNGGVTMKPDHESLVEFFSASK